MNKIPSFTIPLYEFSADEQLTNKALEIAKSQTYRPNQNNKSSTMQPIKSKELINWFNSCLEEVKNDIYKDPIFDIKVTDAWCNKTSYTEKHHTHIHPNSVLSGVFYLTTHEKKCKTKFFLANPYHQYDFNKTLYTSENFVTTEKYIVTEIKPVAGKLIIFPSSLDHGVDLNTTIEDRYTISFNSFFSGTLGKKDNATLLNITVQYPFELE